jgi:hypothetical protein
MISTVEPSSASQMVRVALPLIFMRRCRGPVGRGER